MQSESRSFHPVEQTDEIDVTVAPRIELNLAEIEVIRPEKSVGTLAAELKSLVRRDQKSKRHAMRLARNRIG